MSQVPPNPSKKQTLPLDQSSQKSTVKTFRPPTSGSGALSYSPSLIIHTYPSLYDRLQQFLEQFDKPPNQMYFEILFTEMRDVDVKQLRWKFGNGSVIGMEMFDTMVNGINQLENVRLPSDLQARM